ncbi:glutamine cyclotransferase, partial [Trifolium medium]|nr:glutamine cyclotransferase [Trifolium medium]
MAKTRSLKKKPREPNHTPNPSMATPSPPTRRRKPQSLVTVSAILAVLLVISIICLLLVSS